MSSSGRFTVFVGVVQLSFVVLFAVFVRYPELGLAGVEEESGNITSNPQSHADRAKDEVAKYYPFFQDIHVMMFVGFGFLMTFLKRYGFSSIGLNMLVAALVIQWAILTSGWILHHSTTIHVDMTGLISAEFAAATVLISFGAVLGKVSALQLLIMAVIEVVLFQVNEYIVFDVCSASDIGDSMVVHAFGAYFGLAVARTLYTDDIKTAEHKETSVYHSDLFAMIGTIFLWMFWPSFNSATAVGEGQYRAVINTYLSLAACAVVCFAVSAVAHKDKFNMVHIQNSTLAGGVAIGTMADMIIQPWAALLTGTIAAALSVIGYRVITPFLSAKLNIHDTCGVNNLHGLPGVLSGIGGIICAAIATPALYGTSLSVQFPERPQRSAGEQAAFQTAALISSVGVAIAGGLITGLILRLPIYDQPKDSRIFDDNSHWLLPEEGFPSDHTTAELHSHEKEENV